MSPGLERNIKPHIKTLVCSHRRCSSAARPRKPPSRARKISVTSPCASRMEMTGFFSSAAAFSAGRTPRAVSRRQVMMVIQPNRPTRRTFHRASLQARVRRVRIPPRVVMHGRGKIQPRPQASAHAAREETRPAPTMHGEAPRLHIRKERLAVFVKARIIKWQCVSNTIRKSTSIVHTAVDGEQAAHIISPAAKIIPCDSTPRIFSARGCTAARPSCRQARRAYNAARAGHTMRIARPSA